MYSQSLKLSVKVRSILSSRKDTVTCNKRQGSVCEVTCTQCEHDYIGEKKGSLI